MKDRIARAPGRYSAIVPTEELENLQSGNAFEITLVRDDDPEEIGTPYNKASVLPDDLAETLCPDIEDPTPADAIRALYDGTPTRDEMDAVQGHLLQHDEDIQRLTDEIVLQVGSLEIQISDRVEEEQLAEKVKDIIIADCEIYGPISTEINKLTEVQFNTELVNLELAAYDDSGYLVRRTVTQEEMQTAIGDIETALDNIIAIQNELIGGDGE